MEFHYDRKERLESATPEVRRGQEQRGQKGIFRRNPSLRITLYDLAIIFFVVIVLIPLIRWAGLNAFSGGYSLQLESYRLEEEILVSVRVEARRKKSLLFWQQEQSVENEEQPSMELSFYLDDKQIGETLQDLAPRTGGGSRVFRERLPYSDEKWLKVVVLVDGEENVLSETIPSSPDE